jgi:hypothetical protein
LRILVNPVNFTLKGQNAPALQRAVDQIRNSVGAGCAGDVDATYLASVKRSHAALVAFWTTVAVIATGASGVPEFQVRSGRAPTDTGGTCSSPSHEHL